MNTLYEDFKASLEVAKEIEQRRISALSEVTAEDARKALSRWIEIVARFSQRECNFKGIRVTIPVNVENVTEPVELPDGQTFRTVDSAATDSNILSHLLHGDLRTLFSANPTSVGGDDPDISMYLSKEEMEELTPTEEEKPWLYILGVRIIINGQTQYGQKVEVF